MSTLTASVDLRPVARSVPAARHAVAAVLAGWDARHDADDVALLVTELVSNVIDHVGGEASFTLELAYSDGWLRISLADGSSVRPVVRELDSGNPRGRGLQLVQAIADRWGAEEYRGGKRVWLELRSPDVRPAREFAAERDRGRLRRIDDADEGDRAMSEPSRSTEAAGQGLSDEDMVETVAEQTDSASDNAYVAGKDWDGDPASAPAPDEG